MAERAVGVGDLIALPILRTIDDVPVDLIDAAAERPVVLIFYRGDWCPHSTKMLRAYAAALPAIEAAGGILIAVTAERLDAQSERRANDLPFTVAVDAGNRFAKSLGLVVKPPHDLHPLCRHIGINLPEGNGDDSDALRMSVTYVLAPCGRVTWAHADADLGRSADPADVVVALERLRDHSAGTAKAA